MPKNVLVPPHQTADKRHVEKRQRVSSIRYEYKNYEIDITNRQKGGKQQNKSNNKQIGIKQSSFIQVCFQE